MYRSRWRRWNGPTNAKSLLADFSRGLLRGSLNDLGFLLVILALHTTFKRIWISYRSHPQLKRIIRQLTMAVSKYYKIQSFLHFELQRCRYLWAEPRLLFSSCFWSWSKAKLIISCLELHNYSDAHIRVLWILSSISRLESKNTYFPKRHNYFFKEEWAVLAVVAITICYLTSTFSWEEQHWTKRPNWAAGTFWGLKWTSGNCNFQEP